MAKYFALISAAISLFAFIDCAMRDETLLKRLPKWAWLLIILFFQLLGSVAYLIAGRNGKFKGNGGRGRQKKPRILPPDDDPDFLRKL